MDLPVLDASIGTGSLLFLVLALGIALAFEFVNGFHDTANAVATVIYTKSLSPRAAVLWSGLWNFLGVYFGGIAVAFSIVYLLPVELLLEVGSGAGMAMVLALLTAAIVWNFGTWYLALPASSSHTLIGAVLGVGLASPLVTGKPFGSGVNWAKAGEVGLSLLVSPVVGFVSAALLLLVARMFFRNPALHQPPPEDRPPPFWVRGILCLTCTGVSFAHGSNDGQKGIGLIMLILIGIVPARYALNPNYTALQVRQTAEAAAKLEDLLQEHTGAIALLDGLPARSRDVAAPRQALGATLHERGAWPGSPVETGAVTPPTPVTLFEDLEHIRTTMEGKSDLRNLSGDLSRHIREDILRVDFALAQILNTPGVSLSTEERAQLSQARSQLRGVTDYAPTWAQLSVALALGIGTTVGWKRIVVTVGEKIGKTHMTYAQGASAEVVAMSAIAVATFVGHVPVSTTHVLSSGVAGTMAANRSGLQFATVRNIALAWVLTLPAAMLLSGGLFLLFRLVLT